MVQTRLRLAHEEKTWTDSLLELGEEGIGLLECAGVMEGTEMVESRLGTRQRETLKVRREQYGGIC